MAEESSNEYTPLDLSMKGEAILQDIETSGMAEESSNEYTPLDLSMKGEAIPSTSRDGTQGTSSAVDANRTIADDALRNQGNTHHTPTIDKNSNVDGAPDNGSRSCQPLGSIRSIDSVRLSASHAGMEEAPANFEDGATSPGTTSGKDYWLIAQLHLRTGDLLVNCCKGGAFEPIFPTSMKYPAQR
ncbi:uncharacterized protein [Dermacentor albipictus]|uniref:uncharacterized protein isoform X4 n=1 Tax=Dermacentor albipictus TaxID=60249 RepID=UPI0038FC6506